MNELIEERIDGWMDGRIGVKEEYMNGWLRELE